MGTASDLMGFFRASWVIYPFWGVGGRRGAVSIALHMLSFDFERKAIFTWIVNPYAQYCLLIPE